jgi:PTS system fructose-specific IIC component
VIESLTELLDSSCVTLSLSGRKKQEIIRELVDLLAAAGKVPDAEDAVSKVLERESLTTTGIGGGIAIPHCMAPEIPEMAMAFGRHNGGAKFDAVDRQPVYLFFLIVAPTGAHNDQLRVLSKISRYLHDPSFKNGLLTAATAEDVMDLISERER